MQLSKESMIGITGGIETCYSSEGATSTGWVEIVRRDSDLAIIECRLNGQHIALSKLVAMEDNKFFNN